MADKNSRLKFKEICVFVGSKIKEKWWYLVLLAASTSVVYQNRELILDLQFGKWSVVHLIFLLWIILLVLPLFSEMEILGVKFTKEVRKVAEDVKSDLTDMKMQIMQLQISNSIATNINIENTPMPSEDKMEELIALLHELKRQPEHANEREDEITDKSVYLFKVRLSIEKAVVGLLEKMGYSDKFPLLKAVHMLYKLEVIDAITLELISQVLKIANRGVHGEIVSDEYIGFVKEVFPQIRSDLKGVNDNLYYVSCPKCKYSGYSKYANVCPKCGHVDACE